MGGWGEAVAEFFKTVNRVLKRVWGEQTSEQDSLEAQAEHANTEKQRALDDGDLDRANRWDGELTRLRNAIAAKRG